MIKQFLCCGGTSKATGLRRIEQQNDFQQPDWNLITEDKEIPVAKKIFLLEQYFIESFDDGCS